MHQVKKIYSRPPPRLRTKTGCVRCRARRKKCDERRPTCSACDRLRSECIYRDQNSRVIGLSPQIECSPGAKSIELEDSALDTTSTQPPLYPSLWVKPSGLATERDYNVFQYCATRYVQHVVSPEAGSDFRDVSFVFSIGFDSPWVIHAALAPAALHASFSHLIPKEAAISYTQSALQGLRQAAQTQTNRSAWRQSFLVASLFLGNFEDFYSSPSSHSLIHYKAMAEVLEASMAEVLRLHLSDLSVFERTLLDSVLYHYSTRLLFKSDISAISTSFPSTTMAKYIEAVETECTDTRVQRPVLPVLGKTPPALFLLIFQATWLSRQLPFNDNLTFDMAVHCQAELERIEADSASQSRIDFSRVEMEMETETETLNQPSSNGDLATELYLIAVRIFITKIRHPEDTSNDSPSIQALLAKGISSLQSYDTSQPYSQFICWPTIVLGCAACPVTAAEAGGDESHTPQAQLRSEMRELILEKLIQIWQQSFSGFVRRTARSLKRVWSLPEILLRKPATIAIGSQMDFSSYATRFDGLNALIAKEGLAALIKP